MTALSKRTAVNGKIHLFRKPNEYEYQKEFRIYVERDQITPLVFKIGGLKEIAEIYPSDVISEIKLLSSNQNP